MTLTGQCTKVPQQAVGPGHVQICLEGVSVHTFQFRSLPRHATGESSFGEGEEGGSILNSSKQENTCQANLICKLKTNKQQEVKLLLTNFHLNAISL